MTAVEIKAEIVANVWKHVAEVGDRVSTGEVVSVLESMKMEIPVRSTASGTLVRQVAPESTFVQEGDVIWVVDADA